MTRTLIPSGQLCIAYVYSHDLNTAMSYQALLGGAGIRLDLIHTSNLFSVSFDRYSSVIIGPETGNEKLWGDPALLQANHIMESDRAVLGLGWGGSSFLGAVDLDIGWSRGTTSLATSMLAVDLGHPFWLGPNPIPVPPDRIVQISAAETLSIAIDAPTPPAYLTLVGREPSNPDRYPLVGQYEKYWLWGFNGRPADNTGVGRQLFLNVVHNLPNAACTTSAASPTPLVLTVTPTATPTSTPTITLSPVGSTATPLPAVGGQGLRLHSGTGALSWTGGASQTGYRIARWSPGSGVTLLLPDTPLAALTTSYQDAPASRGSSACYVVFALGGAPASSSSVLARSDVLCFVEASSGGTMTPFELSLGQSALATLAWESTGGLSPDRVMVVPLDGSASHVETIGGSQTPFTYDTAGQPTCFQMQATVDGVIAGATNVVCGVPGASTLGPGGAHQSR